MSETEGRDLPAAAHPVQDNLLSAPPRIINVGLEAFTDEPRRLGTPVVQVDWAPPAGGDPRLMALLARLGE